MLRLILHRDPASKRLRLPPELPSSVPPRLLVPGPPVCRQRPSRQWLALRRNFILLGQIHTSAAASVSVAAAAKTWSSAQGPGVRTFTEHLPNTAEAVAELHLRHPELGPSRRGMYCHEHDFGESELASVTSGSS